MEIELGGWLILPELAGGNSGKWLQGPFARKLYDKRGSLVLIDAMRQIPRKLREVRGGPE